MIPQPYNLEAPETRQLMDRISLLLTQWPQMTVPRRDAELNELLEQLKLHMKPSPAVSAEDLINFMNTVKAAGATMAEAETALKALALAAKAVEEELKRIPCAEQPWYHRLLSKRRKL